MKHAAAAKLAALHSFPHGVIFVLSFIVFCGISLYLIHLWEKSHPSKYQNLYGNPTTFSKVVEYDTAMQYLNDEERARRTKNRNIV